MKIFNKIKFYCIIWNCTLEIWELGEKDTKTIHQEHEVFTCVSHSFHCCR